MRVEEPRGLETLQRLGPQIQAAVEEQPDGLLLHENYVSEEPLHVGMRQYWRDSTRSRPGARAAAQAWWSDYLRDRGGTSFWHETYFRRGGSRRCTSTRATRSVVACFAAVVTRRGPDVPGATDAPNPAG